MPCLTAVHVRLSFCLPLPCPPDATHHLTFPTAWRAHKRDHPRSTLATSGRAIYETPGRGCRLQHVRTIVLACNISCSGPGSPWRGVLRQAKSQKSPSHSSPITPKTRREREGQQHTVALRALPSPAANTTHYCHHSPRSDPRSVTTALSAARAGTGVAAVDLHPPPPPPPLLQTRYHRTTTTPDFSPLCFCSLPYCPALLISSTRPRTYKSRSTARTRDRRCCLRSPTPSHSSHCLASSPVALCVSSQALTQSPRWACRSRYCARLHALSTRKGLPHAATTHPPSTPQSCTRLLISDCTNIVARPSRALFPPPLLPCIAAPGPRIPRRPDVASA